MNKSPDAFRTIREVSEWLDTPAHVLRFWESKFSQIRPVKRAGGRRYYRPNDMMLLGGIKRLLHEDGHTIKRVQRMLGANGVKSVIALSQPLSDRADDAVSSTDEDTVVVSFSSSRAASIRPEPADLTLVEDAEVLTAEQTSPSIPEIEVPADPADKEFKNISLPLSAAILTNHLSVANKKQTAVLKAAYDRLMELRSRQDQNRVL